MGKYNQKFKVGDKARIAREIIWPGEGACIFNLAMESLKKTRLYVTITKVTASGYLILEDCELELWQDWMFEDPEPEFKTGDYIFVRNSEEASWQKKIYLFTHPNPEVRYKFWTIDGEKKQSISDLNSFDLLKWRYAKPYIPEPTLEEKIENLITEIPVCEDGKKKIHELVELIRKEKNES